MKGNIFISVPAADKTNSLPASIDRYDWEEFTYDEELQSEVSALVALGAGLTAPSYTLMTNPEVREFIQANTTEQL
jgi:hypothetical protein